MGTFPLLLSELGGHFLLGNRGGGTCGRGRSLATGIFLYNTYLPRKPGARFEYGFVQLFTCSQGEIGPG